MWMCVDDWGVGERPRRGGEIELVRAVSALGITGQLISEIVQGDTALGISRKGMEEKPLVEITGRRGGGRMWKRPTKNEGNSKPETFRQLPGGCSQIKGKERGK